MRTDDQIRYENVEFDCRCMIWGGVFDCSTGTCRTIYPFEWLCTSTDGYAYLGWAPETPGCFGI
jgi:hypothetical protein